MAQPFARVQSVTLSGEWLSMSRSVCPVEKYVHRSTPFFLPCFLMGFKPCWSCASFPSLDVGHLHSLGSICPENSGLWSSRGTWAELTINPHVLALKSYTCKLLSGLCLYDEEHAHHKTTTTIEKKRPWIWERTRERVYRKEAGKGWGEQHNYILISKIN